MTENRTEIGISDGERAGDTCRATTPPRRSHDSREAIRAAIRGASRADGHAAVMVMLGREVSWGLVQHWMSGRRSMPGWAVDRVCERLEALQAAVQAVRGQDRGQVGKRILMAYNANRRASKDQAGGVELGSAGDKPPA